MGRMMQRLLTAIVVNLVAWVIGILWLLPLVGILMAAIRPYTEVVEGWWHLKEFHVTLRNFIGAWNSQPFPLSRGFVNSFIVTIPSTLIPLLAGALAAYGFARFEFPLRNYFFMALVFFFCLPLQAIAIPVFKLLNSINLLNTLPGLILVHSAWGVSFATIFLRNYFATLPVEVEEAAKVDGASDFRVFFQIVLPMSLPGIVSFSVIQFSWVWSDFFFALLYIHSPEKYLVTQRLTLMRGIYQTSWDLLSAGSIMVMAVPVVLYMVLQKYFIRGMMGWVVKG